MVAFLRGVPGIAGSASAGAVVCFGARFRGLALAARLVVVRDGGRAMTATP